MRSSDFKIHNREKLDKILVELCQMVMDGQKEDNDYYGMVASCVIDNNNNIVKSTSLYHNGKWIHAERAAMAKYEHEIGPLQEGFIIVTTLSPCNEAMKDRYKESCTELINDSPIRKVYCGYSDPSQGDDEYVRKKFNLETTENIKIKELCKRYADTFL